MSITITETLTLEEYIEVFPQDSAVEEDIIQGAINNATITLDTICGGMITKVWAVIDPTDPLYRTDAEHNYIKQAVAKQTQYLVSKNLDMSAGSESYTSGSNSYNETRPRPELVVDETIYQLLAQARVYNPNITTDTTIAKNNVEDFYNPSYDPSQQYITLQLGDNRYIKKNSDYTEKFLYSNTDGNIEYVDIKLSPTGTSSATANFITINGVEWALGGGGSSPYWGNIQGNIQDQTDLYTILTQLEDYCNSLDATKAAQSDLEALQQEVAKKVSKITTAGYGAYGHNGSTETEWIIDANAVAQTIAYRTADGRLRVGTPTEDNNATNKLYVDELVGTSGGTYLGSAQGTGTDVASDEAASKFIGDYLGVSTEITKNSYFNITIATNDVWNEDIYRYIATGNKIDIGGTQYYEYRFGFKFTGDLTLLKQQVATNTTNITTLQSEIVNKIDKIISKTWSELKTMRDGGTLVSGQYYRITDYVATTKQSNTQSANHPFDLIVVAVDTNKLSEKAIAIQHSGDTYFANSNLTSWTVWYCLDNDTNRFAWADATNGKGVIYYLQDEFSNSCWYDWKGIQVKNTNSSDKWYYLFHNTTYDTDASLSPATSLPGVYGNKLGFYVSSSKFQIGCNVFKGNYFFDNTIGNSFYSNTIGNDFYRNTIGNDFYKNTIGNDFYSNTIGNYFYDNTIGNSFNRNTIGNDFNNNTIGNYFANNTIGNDFNDNNTTSQTSQPNNCSFPSGVNGLITTSTTLPRLTKTTYYIGSDSTLKTLD